MSEKDTYESMIQIGCSPEEAHQALKLAKLEKTG